MSTNTSLATINIVFADDATDLRDLLSQALNKEPDLNVIDTAANGEEALQKIDKHNPDILLLDLSMPVLDGTGVLAELQNHPNPPKVVVLTGYGETDLAKACIQAGATGFIEKGTSIPDIAQAIRQAYVQGTKQ